jgi:hypothetical protein
MELSFAQLCCTFPATRNGKLGESQGRKVTGLRERSYGRRIAERT